MRPTAFVLVLLLALGVLAATPAAATPLHASPLRDYVSAPCAPGATYEPACDVNHDGAVNVLDVQLTAGHWNQTGTWLSDNSHNHLGQTWTGNHNALNIGGSFSSPTWAPLSLSNSTGSGVRISAPGGSGVWVESAGTFGMLIDSAGLDGIFICRTGTISTCSGGVAQNNAVEIGNAQGAGLYVGYAGVDGVYVSNAGDDGVDVAGSNLAGYFAGDIQVTGNCIGCLLATFGVNAGDKPLVPGDLVSLAGLRASGVDSVPVLMEVQAATGGDAVVGVVQGWAELVTEEHPRPTEIGRRLVPREGAAAPGQYVTIAYSGLAQVKASGPLEKGAQLTVGDDGRAKTLQTRTLDGMEVTEGAQPIGVALEGIDDSEGLIWVLVNVQ